MERVISIIVQTVNFYCCCRAQFWQRNFEGSRSCDRNLGVAFVIGCLNAQK